MLMIDKEPHAGKKGHTIKLVLVVCMPVKYLLTAITDSAFSILEFLRPDVEHLYSCFILH